MSGLDRVRDGERNERRLKAVKLGRLGICQFRATQAPLGPCYAFALLIPCVLFFFQMPSQWSQPKNKTKQNKMVSNILNSCLRDQKASEKTLKSCLIPGEDLVKVEKCLQRKPWKSQGVGFLLSELSIKVQPHILGALNKNHQQAVLPVCAPLKGRANVSKWLLYISQNSDSSTLRSLKSCHGPGY